MATKPGKSATSMAASPGFAEVALPIPLRQTFTYSIPEDLREAAAAGSRVIVPFGSRQLTGYIVKLDGVPDEKSTVDPEAIKPVREVLDAKPLLTEEIIGLTKWAADYYASSWGEMLKAALPAGINATLETAFSITNEGIANLNENPDKETQKITVLRHLEENKSLTLKELKKLFNPSAAQRITSELLGLGLIEKKQQKLSPAVKPKKQKAVRLTRSVIPDKEIEDLTPSQRSVIEILQDKEDAVLLSELEALANVSASPVKTLKKKGLLEILKIEIRRDPIDPEEPVQVNDFILTDGQKSVLEEIESTLNAGKYNTFLLHGVTGSGKTEVYIRAIRSVLGRKRSALMLVPEISLTPVFSKRLRLIFGDDVAILHSSLSAGERFDEWRRIRTGDAKVVIGTRSAVFAPLKDLGLVIIDEEHDTSYRQHEMPFYNARDIAIVRANQAEAAVILGSATPALESFHNAQTGKYRYLQLPNRIGNRPLAQAELIDMREVFKVSGKDSILSPQLLEAVEETHKNGEQSIILLNRRGFSQFVLCRSCGESVRCVNCDITLTFHKRDQLLVCHYCNHRIRKPSKCPSCESEFIYFVGEGTEQIEDILRNKFPDIRIARVDRDTTRRRKQLENVLSEFGKGELDMLVGTQMIAKGHDFHNVTLVGVVSVDNGLSMPDFRSAERTFQLLTQVAGRAGRGDLPGRVLIQTYHPDHYALRHAANQSYEEFYKQEILYRRRMHYPPFVALASILFKHPNYNYAYDNAKTFRAALDEANSGGNSIVLGPAPATLARLKGEHRLQLIIKSRNRSFLRELIETGSAEAENNGCDMKIVFTEIDPVNLL
ncbi:MAG: primosomal protein N' [Pyrinomonadaceae bacterium]